MCLCISSPYKQQDCEIHPLCQRSFKGHVRGHKKFKVIWSLLGKEDLTLESCESSRFEQILEKTSNVTVFLKGNETPVFVRARKKRKGVKVFEKHCVTMVTDIDEENQ